MTLQQNSAFRQWRTHKFRTSAVCGKSSNATGIASTEASTRGYQSIRFSSASPLLCQMWFDLLSMLGPLSRIWQETQVSQHQRMHLNRILDNIAPGTAMKCVSSCQSLFRTCKALQVNLVSLTEVQLADILITMSLSRSTSHSSSSCSLVIKALRWLVNPLQSHWEISEPKNPQRQKTGTAASSLGIGAVGATSPYVELHSDGSDVAGHIFSDGMGIPQVF